MTGLSSLTRASLAQLAREYMLAAQFNSRAGYAALRINHGDAAYREVAIDNWTAASPVYTRRMQRAMGFAGQDDVAAIFKGLQLDVGFAHQYFDVHYRVSGPQEGRFWLHRCGALLEAEPRGEEAVRVMCHDIEDPTFDATAAATNPRARMRPVHRPPRSPANRQPHCEWRVFVDPAEQPLQQPDISVPVANTLLARLELSRAESRDPGGLEDYSGSLFEQLEFERFSHPALVTLCGELAIAQQLLVTSLMLVVHQRYGLDAAREVGTFQLQGAARLVSERLAPLVAADLQGIEAVLAVLEVHPVWQPAGYFGWSLERTAGGVAILRLDDSPARQENHEHGWYALPDAARTQGLQSLVLGVDPRAVVTPVREGWEISLQSSPVEEEEPLSVQVARSSVLSTTRLQNHIPLLQL